MKAHDTQEIRQLFDEYLQMYASRDDRLTEHFSDDFSGFTGGGDFLVKERKEWVAITRQDFRQVIDPLRIELKDLAIQSLSDTIAVTTGFLIIHLPIEDHILSRETARLVLIFRKEPSGWKITHSSISIPYYLVREGEVYPMQELEERNKALEEQVVERTLQLSKANEHLSRIIEEQKQAKEALRISSERYQTILNTAMDGFWVVSQQGRILEVNDAYCQMSGYSKQELLNIHVADLEVHEAKDDVVAHNKKIMALGGDRFEAQHRRKDGTLFDVEVSAKFIPDDGGFIFGFLRDVTERRLTENALRDTEWKFRALFDNGPIGVAYHRMMYDQSGKPVDYFFIDANDKYIELTGVDPRGKKVTEAFPGIENDPFDWIGTFGRIARTGEALRFEQYLQANDRWYDCVGYQYKQDHFVAAFQEITERKRAEAALHESESRWKFALEGAGDGVWDWNIQTGDAYFSPRYMEMLGYSGDEVWNRSDEWSKRVHPEDVPGVMSALKPYLDGKPGPASVEYRMLCKDGSWKSVLGRGMVVGSDNNDKTLRMIGTNSDLTDRKTAEQERHSMERQLLHTQKLESLGVLAGGIAHDFNNILTSIVGNTDLALSRLNPESPVLDNLKRIEKSAIRATDLAKQMLAYSGKGKFVVEAIDINRLVEEMGHMLEVSISKKAILRYNLTPLLPSVEADATQLRQIVMNLVINASEAIGDKSGIIAITTGCINCDQTYLTNAWLNYDIPEGLYDFIEVADTGCGMDKETQAKMFDPFFTTKFTGRGLGMAAVQGIVRSHKGAINVYSELGKGSSFKILLPAGTLPVEIFNSIASDEKFRGEGTVLLVDDEETVLAIGSEMLREFGFTVITANDGREAVAAFKANQGLHCVILDLTMPHLDGEQTFRELRMLEPNVKVIMSSGYSEYEVTQKFAGKGLVGFIQKPYKMSTLRAVLAKL